MGQHDNSVATFFEWFAEAWKTNDGAAVAELFTDDGTLINPFGQRADGRAAVAAMYSEYFDGMLQGTTTTLTIESVRPVETTHAFADAEQTIHGSNGDIVLVAHLATLLRRDGDSWRFADSRPSTTPATT